MSKPSAAFFKKKAPTVSNVKPCGDRDTRLFIEYLQEDPMNIHLLIARALLNDNKLDWFELEAEQPHGNECVFSYPDSDWYSVYLKTPSGEILWTMDEDTGDVIHPKFYFKINITSDESGKLDATITESTFDVPKGLKTKKNCVIIDGRCSDPPTGSGTRSTKPKSDGASTSAASQVEDVPKRKPGRPPKAKPVEDLPQQEAVVAPEMIAQLTALKLGPSTAGQASTSKGRVPAQSNG